ncbi:MAG: hypothetical protein ACRC7N_21265 [Clostridium sp.]
MLLKIKCEYCDTEDLQETNCTTTFYCPSCDDEIFINECEIDVMKNIKLELRDVQGNEIELDDIVMLNDNKKDLAKVCFGEFGVRNIETEEIVDYVIGFYLKTIDTDELSKIEPFCWDIQLNKNIIQNTNLKVMK